MTSSYILFLLLHHIPAPFFLEISREMRAPDVHKVGDQLLGTKRARLESSKNTRSEESENHIVLNFSKLFLENFSMFLRSQFLASEAEKIKELIFER